MKDTKRDSRSALDIFFDGFPVNCKNQRVDIALNKFQNKKTFL